MQSPEKGEAKRNLARARRVVRKEQKSTQAKVTEVRQQNTHDSNVETVESMDTELLVIGTSSPNLQERQGHAKVEIQSDRNHRK